MHKYLSPRNYMRYFQNRAIQLASTALQPAEKYFAKKYGEQGIRKYPPVFIIGAPRTGSTIFYQTITNCWDVGYITNLECRLCRSIIVASIFSRKMFRNKAHDNYESYHGSTKGLNSPSECGQFWYRWFPTDRHFVDKDELNSSQQKEMRAVVGALITVKNRPLFFKNMNCGQRLAALSQIFPEAIFLNCVRDPLYVAQSLLETRKRVYGNYDTWWSIMPKNFSQLQSLHATEQVVAQIYNIETQINKDLKQYFPGRYIRVQYEDFCNNPERQIQDIMSFLESHGMTVSKKNQCTLDLVCNRNRIIIDLSIIDELEKHIGRYFH